MKRYEDLIAVTAESPEFIQRSESGSTYYYYRLTGRKFYKSEDLYVTLVVGVNDQTKSGKIRTAHLVEHVRKKGDIVWIKH